MTALEIIQALEYDADPDRARSTARYFKTGPGEYGEGDVFLGYTVPALRKFSKQYYELSLPETEKLLRSKYHEARTVALYILVHQYGKKKNQEEIYQCYLKNTAQINNWDLVDTSAEFIIGPHVEHSSKEILATLAHSDNIWERRIAMLSCFHYIKQGNAAPAFVIIEILKNDRHDLIQKAVGWMLREIGKRCSREELTFWLKKDNRYKSLPRTTLRYTIEHFSPELREQYLQGIV